MPTYPPLPTPLFSCPSRLQGIQNLGYLRMVTWNPRHSLTRSKFLPSSPERVDHGNPGVSRVSGSLTKWFPRETREWVVCLKTDLHKCNGQISVVNKQPTNEVPCFVYPFNFDLNLQRESQNLWRKTVYTMAFLRNGIRKSNRNSNKNKYGNY